MEARLNAWLEHHDARMARFYSVCNTASLIAATLFFIAAVCHFRWPL